MVEYLGFTHTLFYKIIGIISQYINNFIIDFHIHLVSVFSLSI
jgi:hypothetical protein